MYNDRIRVQASVRSLKDKQDLYNLADDCRALKHTHCCMNAPTRGDMLLLECSDTCDIAACACRRSVSHN